MCGYGNRVPHGWHRISDEMIVRDGEPRVTGDLGGIQIVQMPPLIWLPGKSAPTRRQAEALLSCRRRREWRGTVIPEAEHCEYVKLCDTDRLALGDALPMY